MAQRIQSVCECQALLEAELDDERRALSGWARRPNDPPGTRENAPAIVMTHGAERYDVAWHCPMCGRNAMRSFTAA